MGINQEKIKRFVSGKFSFNDYSSVSSFFRNEELNEGLLEYMEDDWSNTESNIDNPKRLEQLLDKLHHQINLNSAFKTSGFQRIYQLFSKIAVVLFIPALITIIALSYWSVSSTGKNESWAEIYSPVGSRTQFQLPDGSHGWLNSGSSIKYPINFSKNRQVEVSGEAWFDVVHLSSEEFIVATPFFDVKVLGTQFNVVAYPNENTAEVILERGKVAVLGKDNLVKAELTPDQHLVYDKLTKEATTTDIDSKSYTSWKEGVLIFKNAPMYEIARRLERKYHTEITLHGDSLRTSIFRATFEDESLDEICKMLSTVAPIKYKIHRREKLPDNTFANGKIEMWLKN